MLMPSPSPHPELLSCFVCLIRLWLLITHAVCVPIKKMYVQMDRVKRNKNKNKSISGAKYVECSKKKKPLENTLWTTFKNQVCDYSNSSS